MIKNVLHLLVYQVFNFVLPLVLLPFLVSVLSHSAYQDLVINQTLVMICIAIVNYGFDVKAVTHLVDMDTSDKSQFISAIYTVKLLLFLLVAIFYVTISFYFYELSLKEIAFGLLWFASFLPLNIWFYSFKEKFDVISKATVLPKVLFMPLVFFLVTNDSDVWKYFAIYSMTTLITSCYLFLKMFTLEKGLSFRFVTVAEVTKTLTDGFGFFISQVSVMLITNVFTLLLPIWLTPYQFTVFNVADRGTRILCMLTSPFSNALFPVMAKTIKLNRVVAFHKISSIVRWSTFLALIGFLLFYIIGYEILDLLFTDISSELYTILKFMIVIPYFVFLNNLFGTQIGINLGQDNKFARVVLFSGIVNLILAIILIPYFEVNGAVFVVVFSQFVLLVGMFLIAIGCGYLKCKK